MMSECLTPVGHLCQKHALATRVFVYSMVCHMHGKASVVTVPFAMVAVPFAMIVVPFAMCCGSHAFCVVSCLLP